MCCMIVRVRIVLEMSLVDDQLVPRVLRLFGQRLVVRRDSREINLFHWLHRRPSVKESH